MKKILLMLTLLVICFASCKKEITDNDGNYIIPFKDPNFLEALIANNVDTDGDGQISFDEAKAVKSLNVSDSDSQGC